MTDHALLIPTSEGPVGGIVSEPAGPPRATVLILSGHGPPARSGVNSFWARTARSLAELGVVVLRIDYSRQGETLPLGEDVRGQIPRRDLELRLLGQIVPWLRERVPGVPLHLVGICSGGRASIELIGRHPSWFAGSFLVAPLIQTLFDPESGAEPESVDPQVVAYLRTALDRMPVWVLLGDGDICDVPRLVELLGPDSGLEVEVVPGMALHFADHPPVQRELYRRLSARICAVSATTSPDTRAAPAWV